jgi:hypothetical protein
MPTAAPPPPDGGDADEPDPTPPGGGVAVLARPDETDWTVPVLPADDDGRPDEAAGGDGPRWSGWLDRLSGPTWPQSLTTLVIVVACTVFTFVELKPDLLFRETTPTGGDMGAHVWLPAFVKAHLIPSLRLTGWAPDWYAGFPALTYYFPLPMFAIAFISYVIPYDIAFKLVTVVGLVTMPAAVWAFGRLSRARFPVPACMAVASVAYLFSRDFTIYGGNIASTMAGEFSFSISLSLALLFLGLVSRGLRTGRGRALAAVVLACCALCHILPLFFAIGGSLLMWVLAPSRRRLRFLVPVLVVAGLVVAVWALPFEYRLPYATDMGYAKLTNYLTSLFPRTDLWLFVLAAVGAALSFVRRNAVGTWLTWMTGALAVTFCVVPTSHLWNARVLPFWFLCLYLLVGVAFAEVGAMVAEGRLRRVLRGSLWPVPVVVTVVGFIWVGYPLRILPFGHTTASGGYSWLHISSPSSSSSFVPDWVEWNYSGYQSPAKSREAEYFAVVDKMAALGADPADGCGRAMWEYEPSLDQMGTPDALMLLPYWTDGCIDSMEGLYYESSATTPYHFLNAAELSDQPSDPMRGLDYPSSPDVVEGVEHLQMLGVKYFMAVTPDVEAAADADSSLQLVGSVGPFSVSQTSGSSTSVVQQTWKIYKVLDAALVTPLVNQPVVMTGLPHSAVYDAVPETAWLKASESWYLSPSRWELVDTLSGPSWWLGAPAPDPSPPRTPLPPVQVSDIHEGTDTISFDVSRPGVPVEVRTSYFPNWQASGAGTVYRATPNLMVVVPTSTHVELHFGYTPVDWIGFLMTLAGLAGLVVLVRPTSLDLVLRRRRDVPVYTARHVAGAGPLPDPHQGGWDDDGRHNGATDHRARDSSSWASDSSSASHEVAGDGAAVAGAVEQLGSAVEQPGSTVPPRGAGDMPAD